MEKFDYIIIGAGAAGVVLAKEIAQNNKKVLLVEKGYSFNLFGQVLFAPLYHDNFALLKSRQGIVIHRGYGLGGTTVIGCGNAVTPPDSYYEKIGIDFRAEVAEAKRECFVIDDGIPCGPVSKTILESFRKLGYEMKAMPKFNKTGKCVQCGECILGCKYGHKWTTRDLMDKGFKQTVRVVTGTKAINFSKSKDNLILHCESHGRKLAYNATKIILSAGGIGTPIILQNSGIEAGSGLFADLFNVTFGYSKKYRQRSELVMATVCDQFHEDKGFILSPYTENIFGYIIGSPFDMIAKVFSLKSLVGIMTKICDERNGRVYRNGSIDKSPTLCDLKKLQEGSNIARDVLGDMGICGKNIFVSKTRGAHPGGTAAIGEVVDRHLETKEKNVYVCDASILPFAPGMPPTLLLLGLSKWLVRNVLEV
ncbi:MAG: GMC family oxidoreductase N-terminal domain-containing protein [Patescibacteria group bacterium]|nr:GMC family oxidoreductase N-terminal domain-containing protein [Patescibacteria group bacterium]